MNVYKPGVRPQIGLVRRGIRIRREWLSRTILLVLSWLLWFPAALLAQQAQPQTYADFEGKKVSRVDISQRPGFDVAPFRKLIAQKAGQPFSMSAIRESVAALQQTKEFSQVQIKVTPEQAGLDVLFILQPAYYIGIITFPGATNRFAYTELLQAANIPEQTPFTKDVLPQGQNALVRFFHTHGYFTASVTPHSQTDDTHRIVNLVFDVDLHQDAKIGVIDFEGIPASQAAELRGTLRSWWARIKRDSLKPGQKYSQNRIPRSIEYIRARLRRGGRLAPVVRLASTNFRPETNRVDITFQVDRGPLLSVRVVGAHMWRRTIKKLVPIFEENSVDEDLIDEGERNLVSYFQSKGFFDAKINTHVDRQPQKVDVVYQVNRGVRHKVEAVYFQGNHYFDDDKLAASVVVKKAGFLSRGSFSNDLVRTSQNALLALYKDAGFADVKVQTRVDEVDVTFIVEEGPQNHVNSIRLSGNDTQSFVSLISKHPLHSQPGKPYSPRAVQLDRNDILAAYLDRGYLNATFQSNATAENGDTHLLNVVYTIDEGPHTLISDVVLLGAKRTKPDFIRLITGPKVTPGEALSTGDLLTAESNLYNLNIFDWASVQPRQPVTNQTDSEVLEKVHEEKRNAINYGGGVEVIPRSGNIPVGEVALPGFPPIGLGNKFTASQKSFWGPRGSFDYTRNNIFGRAESFTASTLLSRLDQRFAFTFTNPYFRGSSWSSLISLSGERTTQNPIFAAEVGLASFQLQKPLNAKRTKNLILRYDFDRTILTNVTIPSLVLPSDRRVRLSTFSAEYTRDTRDKPLDAHHGVYQIFNFGVSPTTLGSSADFIRFLGQTAFYIPVRPWLTWANNFRLGFATPFAGSTVPLSEKFFSGGADSLRGFPINGAGPQRPVQVCSNPADSSTCTLISVPVGGESLFIFNSEARFPIWTRRNIGGVFFYDGGNVYAHINLQEMVNNYSNTIGFGLRYNTPVGPVRLDIGRNLNPVPGVNATQYFVTLGQAF
ncbi:MAG TPA: POTRA domain-containing protein [Candidatus Acidoferrales bacterium]|nr:POTRA domain-containing protein [Candidatus Acidoferrales bacterium]